jgi:hypothetical protein
VVKTTLNYWKRFALDFVYQGNNFDSVKVKYAFYIQRKHDFQYQLTLERISLHDILSFWFFIQKPKDQESSKNPVTL